MKKMLGIVKWYKKEKGYGYIVGGDGTSYYFELINTIDNEEYKTGDKVLFIPNYIPMEYASSIELIK